MGNNKSILRFCKIGYNCAKLNQAKSQKLYNMATESLQICKNMDKCCKNFIVLYSLFLSSLFIFSFLFSLTLQFPLSSPCISSLPLRPVRDVHPQWRRHSSDDDGVAPTTTVRSATLNLTSATQSHSSHSISPMLSHAWSRRSHLEAVVDLTLSHSTSLWLWVFFFSLQFGLIWWWWWVVGCGRWQWQWWWAVGVMALSYLFESMAICLFELVLNRWWFGIWGVVVLGDWYLLVFFFFSCFVGGFCFAGCVMVGWWWLLLPCWAYVVVKWWLVAVVTWWLVFVCCWWLR